jgi:hypothetical protein
MVIVRYNDHGSHAVGILAWGWDSEVERYMALGGVDPGDGPYVDPTTWVYRNDSGCMVLAGHVHPDDLPEEAWLPVGEVVVSEQID